MGRPFVGLGPKEWTIPLRSHTLIARYPIVHLSSFYLARAR